VKVKGAWLLVVGLRRGGGSAAELRAYEFRPRQIAECDTGIEALRMLRMMLRPVVPVRSVILSLLKTPNALKTLEFCGSPP
jgi:hypothetical protein